MNTKKSVLNSILKKASEAIRVVQLAAWHLIFGFFYLTLIISASYIIITHQYSLVKKTENEILTLRYRKEIINLIYYLENYMIINFKEEWQNIDKVMQKILGNFEKIKSLTPTDFQIPVELKSVEDLSKIWKSLYENHSFVENQRKYDLTLLVLMNIWGYYQAISDKYQLSNDPDQIISYLLKYSEPSLFNNQLDILNLLSLKELEKTNGDIDSIGQNIENTIKFTEKLTSSDNFIITPKVLGNVDFFDLEKKEKRFTKYANNLVKGLNINDKENIINLGRETINSNILLWNSIQNLIENQLDSNLSTFNSQFKYTSMLSGFFILIIALFRISVFLEWKGRANNVFKGYREIFKGNLDYRVELIANDEIGSAEKAVNFVGEKNLQLFNKLSSIKDELNQSLNSILLAFNKQKDSLLEQDQKNQELIKISKSVVINNSELKGTIEEVTHIVDDTANYATSGTQAMKDMESAKTKILDSLNFITLKLADLEKYTTQIKKVIENIFKVSDQINLLSLNAALESVKSSGLSITQDFSVIAREIRRLADQTSNETFDVEVIVKDIIFSILASDQAAQNSETQVIIGMNNLDQVSFILNLIIEKLNKQINEFKKINNEILDQTESVEKIYHSIIEVTVNNKESTELLSQFQKFINELTKSGQSIQEVIEKSRYYGDEAIAKTGKFKMVEEFNA